MPFETFVWVDLRSRSPLKVKLKNGLELVRAITCKLMHRFENNLAVFSLRSRSAI